jgi:phage baseplate assembly protein W
MANLLDRFHKNVVGSKKKIYDYLPKISPSGDFQRIENINVIISSWNNILQTPLRTYIHDPEFGSELHKMVFEPADEMTIARIKKEIEYRIRLYDDRAYIEKIDVQLNPSKKSMSVNVFIEYKEEKGTLSLKFDDTTLEKI